VSLRLACYRSDFALLRLAARPPSAALCWAGGGLAERLAGPLEREELAPLARSGENGQLARAESALADRPGLEPLGQPLVQTGRERQRGLLGGDGIVGFIDRRTGVTCGPDGGCIY
jgi:hypothetical protein